MNDSDHTSKPPATTSGGQLRKPPSQTKDSLPPRSEPGSSPAGSQRSLAALVTQEHFSGPLPPPSILRQYDEVLPGAAERLIAMAEREQQFSHDIAKSSLQAEVDESRRGSRGALIVSISAFAASVLLGLVGAHVAAATVGGTTVVGLATAFILGRKMNRGGTEAEQMRAPESEASSRPKKKRKK